jgi:hypothetical protein
MWRRLSELWFFIWLAAINVVAELTGSPIARLLAVVSVVVLLVLGLATLLGSFIGFVLFGPRR